MSLDDRLVAELDGWMLGRGYSNRSEAMRDLIRHRVEADRLARDPDTTCVATLSYVYTHGVRDLPDRLTRAQHDRHDLVVATLHVHLSHDMCLESTILRGTATAVRSLSDRILAQPAVRHGYLHVVPVEAAVEDHAHGSQSASPHLHLRPKT